MDCTIRPAESADISFLEEMLFGATNWRGEQRDRNTRVADPNINRYLNGWKRPGDAGVVAVNETGDRIGAAWFRFFSADEHGYGFISAAIPEITIGVSPPHRGKGIGTALLRELIAIARCQGIATLSLSVEVENPAHRLYERVGFRPISEEDDSRSSRIVIARVKAPAPGRRRADRYGGEVERLGVTREDLDRWCSLRLGSTVSHVLFESGFLSTVIGVALSDGRQVVCKIRRPAGRIATCFAIQRAVWESGFPCPQPLAGPAMLGDAVATAETLVAGGDVLRTADAPEKSATALAWLISLTSRQVTTQELHPPPPWVWWDHPAEETWPAPDDRDSDLNEHQGPEWVETIGMLIHQRFRDSPLASIPGHCDWWSGNVRWDGGDLQVVHDWDSIAARPEAMLVGAAAANFSATEPGTEPTVEESEAFMDAYETARGRSFTDQEREQAWAAGLWVRVFDAKKESLDMADGPILTRLAKEVEARCARAGLPFA